MRITASAPDRWFRSCARIHRSQLAVGLLAQMGERFLSLVYRHLAGDPDATLMAVVENDEVLGFVSGVRGGNSLLLGLLKRFPIRAPLLAALHLLTHPRSIQHALEIIQHMTRRRQTGQGAELLSIAVAPDALRRGIGTRLFQELRDEFQRRGASEFTVLVAETQQDGLAFYAAQGGSVLETTAIGPLPAKRLVFNLAEK
ncbi:MAG: GNAT family N-acetyltransferase [Rhodospirillales bacterium]|nr:GNAT family N-acetyltransferase [Rhodospirillales bacterium]